jgi:hypothetical protein
MFAAHKLKLTTKFIYLFIIIVQLFLTAWGHHPTGSRTCQKLYSIR